MRWPVVVAVVALVVIGSLAFTLTRHHDEPAVAAKPALPQLRTTFTNPSLPPATRVEALRQVAALGGPDDIAWLGQVASSDDKLAAQAASALGSVTAPGAAPALAAIALDAKASALARAGALRGLAKTGVREHAGDLAGLVADSGSPPRVREESALALMKLGSPAEVPALSKALADDDEQVRISVEQALGAIGGADAKAALQARRAQNPSQAEQVFLDRALGAH